MSFPGNEMKRAIAEHYGLTPKMQKCLTDRFIEQLRLCKSEESRRILLGVSK